MSKNINWRRNYFLEDRILDSVVSPEQVELLSLIRVGMYVGDLAIHTERSTDVKNNVVHFFTEGLEKTEAEATRDPRIPTHPSRPRNYLMNAERAAFYHGLNFGQKQERESGISSRLFAEWVDIAYGMSEQYVFEPYTEEMEASRLIGLKNYLLGYGEQEGFFTVKHS